MNTIVINQLNRLPILFPFGQAVDVVVSHILIISLVHQQFFSLGTLSVRDPVVSLLNDISVVEIRLLPVLQPFADMRHIRLPGHSSGQIH